MAFAMAFWKVSVFPEHWFSRGKIEGRDLAYPSAMLHVNFLKLNARAGYKRHQEP